MTGHKKYIKFSGKMVQYSAMFINKGPTHIWEYASAPYTTLYYIQCHVY